MPVWSAAAIPTPLRRGVPVTVFEEALSDGNASVAVAIPSIEGQNANIALGIAFGSAPTTVDYQLQVAMNNVDAEFFDLGASMSATGGGLVTNIDVVARFARIIANDADTEVVTGQIMLG